MRRSTASRGRTTTLGSHRLLQLLVVVSLLAPVLVHLDGAAADPVSDKRAVAARLATQLAVLNSRSSSLAEAFDQARVRLSDVNAKLAAAQTQLTQTSGTLSDAQHRVKEMAIQSYVRGGAVQQLSLFIPSSANEIGLRTSYVKSVTANTNDAVDALHAAKTELGHLRSQLTAAQTDATNAVARVDAAKVAAAAADARIAAAYAKAKADLGQALLDQARQEQAAANQARIDINRVAVNPRLSAGRKVSPVFAPAPPPGPGAGSAIGWAKAELGKPYVYGGSGPDSFDCSGLTSWAWGHAGHSLPHSSEMQYSDTTHVSVADLQPGDLVFFGSPPHHVGIYVGGGQMINALHSGTNVEYDSIYMEGDLIGGGRVN